jgi:hypothetical protein
VKRESLAALKATLREQSATMKELADSVKGKPEQSALLSARRNIEDALFILTSLEEEGKA